MRRKSTAEARLKQLSAALEAETPKPSAGRKKKKPSAWDVRLMAWGSGSRGQLGLGDTRMRAAPAATKPLRGEPALLAAGSTYSACVTEDGRLWCWGSSAAAGGKEAALSRKPRPLPCLARVRVAVVACGEDHTLLATRRGRALSWGSGAQGRLGHGDEQRVPAPRQIAALEGRSVALVAVGETHSAVVDADGAVLTFGGGVAGQLGLGDLLDRRVPTAVSLGPGGGEPAAAVACGLNHTVVCTKSGAVYTWGWGEHGRLGLGEGDDALRAEPQRLGLADVDDVACGGSHTLARTAAGRVYAWGWNAFGQLGHDGAEGVPTLIDALPAGVAKVACGYAHSAALVDGQLFVWGFGEEGQVGVGSEANARRPARVRIDGSPYVVDVACGRVHTLAIVSREAPEARAWRLETEARQHEAAVVVGAAVRGWLCRLSVERLRVARLADEARRRAEAEELAREQAAAKAEAERLARLQQLREQAERELAEASERHRREQEALARRREAAAGALGGAVRGWLARLEAGRRRAAAGVVGGAARAWLARLAEGRLRRARAAAAAAAEQQAAEQAAAEAERAAAEAERLRLEQEAAERLRLEQEAAERRQKEEAARRLAAKRRADREAFEQRQRERDEARLRRQREREEAEAKAARKRRRRKSSKDLLADRESREAARLAREEARRRRAEAVAAAEAAKRQAEKEARAAARAAAARRRRKSCVGAIPVPAAPADDVVEVDTPTVIEMSPRLVFEGEEFDGLRPASTPREEPAAPSPPPPPSPPAPAGPMPVRPKQPRFQSVGHWAKRAGGAGAGGDGGGGPGISGEEQRRRARALSHKGQRVEPSAAERREKLYGESRFPPLV